jgi:hypothetical protein
VDWITGVHVPPGTKFSSTQSSDQRKVRARGSILVKVLSYKQEGHGFRPDEVKEYFQFTQFVRLTQPLIELSTRSREIMFLGRKVSPVRWADNFVAI